MKKLASLALAALALTTTHLNPSSVLAQDASGPRASDNFPALNPLGNATLSGTFSSLLPLLLVVAGLLLFVMLLMGGFTMLTNPTNPEAQAGGKARITYALVGFFLLIISYWLIQILEIIFKISIV